MKSILAGIAAMLIVMLLALSFRSDWRNVAEGGTIDFRNRITGARVLMRHHDAYHYKWNPSEPEELCDLYNNAALPINKVTVTPTLLMFNFPLAALPYRPAQFLWLIAQWLMLLGAGFLWLRAIPSPAGRWLWAAALAGFTFTVAWRHHTDRGQAYVVMLFLLACWTRVTWQTKSRQNLWGGLLAGLLVALRPPLLLALGPFLWLRRRGQLAWAALALALFAGLPLLWSPACWTDYQSGMQKWSELYRTDRANPRPPPQAFPAEVEDIPLNVLGRFDRAIPFADSSVFAAGKAAGVATMPALPVALALVILMAGWFWWARSQPEEVLIMGVMAWSFLIDIFVPAYRNSYTDIMILSVLAFALTRTHGFKPLVWLLLAAWPAGWMVSAAGALVYDAAATSHWPELARQCLTLLGRKWFINLPTLIMLAGAVLALLHPIMVRKPQPTAAHP